MGVAPQLQPLQGMLLRRSTDIYPKELARDMREFFNSLLTARLNCPSAARESRTLRRSEWKSPMKRLPRTLAGYI